MNRSLIQQSVDLAVQSTDVHTVLIAEVIAIQQCCKAMKRYKLSMTVCYRRLGVVL